jgi:hypothetical protein
VSMSAVPRWPSDDFLKARVAAQRIPARMKFEKAVAEGVRNAFHRRDLFDGAIFLTSPSVDLRQINGYVRAVDSVLGNWQQFTAATSLSKCLFFPLMISQISRNFAIPGKSYGRLPSTGRVPVHKIRVDSDNKR